MNRHCSGVQCFIKEVVPMVMNVHCHSHCLNIVLVDSIKSVPKALKFWKCMYVFMSASKAHTIYIQQKSTIHPGKPVRELQHLAGHVDFMQWMLFVAPVM